MAVMPTPNAAFATGLFAFCQLLYVVALVKVMPYFFHPFAPSIGAFTFPLAITATAIAKYNAVFAHGNAALLTLQGVECAVITVVVLVVLLRYTRYLATCWPRPAA